MTNYIKNCTFIKFIFIILNWNFNYKNGHFRHEKHEYLDHL